MVHWASGGRSLRCCSTSCHAQLGLLTSQQRTFLPKTPAALRVRALRIPFLGPRNKASETGWLKTTGIYLVPVPDSRRPPSGCWQGWLLPAGGSEEKARPCLSAGSCRPPAVLGSQRQAHSGLGLGLHSTVFPLRLCVLSPLAGTPVTGFRARPGDLILTNSICKDCFLIRSPPQVLGSELEPVFSGDNSAHPIPGEWKVNRIHTPHPSKRGAAGQGNLLP